MSLFKACTWWTAQCPDLSANYDSYSLHCCRFGLDENEKDYIVIGSHAGHLSIFKPTPPEKTDDVSDEDNQKVQTTTHKPTDLLLELKLSHPIIGILSGKFLGTKNDGKSQLAILHPMKVSVYSIQTTQGIAEHGNQSKLELCFEHKFQRFAYSFCKGSFGGVKGKDFLCIVHINSTLSMYEQDGIRYECALPSGASNRDRNIPSVLCYIPRIDSFITVSAAYELECYRYQDLGQSVESSKEIEPAWTCCIGEYALDVSAQQISNDETVIVILGENNLICTSDTGKLRFIKRLDYSPMCFHSFVLGWYWEPNCRLLTAIASDQGSILIYEESRLIWSLQLTGAQVPVAIQRSNITGLPGAIVTLGETGLLTVCYLGAQPYPFQVPPLNLHELNYELAQKELTELEKEIRAGVDFTDVSLAVATAERDLQVQILLEPGKLDLCKFKTKVDGIDVLDLKQCLVSVTLKATTKIEQVQINFDANYPLVCSKPLHMFKDLVLNHSQRIDTFVYMMEALPVSSIDVRAIISFINTQSICRIIEKKISLPLEMFYKQVQPLKEGSAVKLTFSVDNVSTVPSLAALLSPDFSIDVAQAIGLRATYTPDAIVTIVAAKNSNRFRVQSNELAPLAVIVNILLNRLKKIRTSSASAAATNMKIIMAPHIPVDHVVQAIEKYYQAGQEYAKSLKTFESRTAQMRLIQRRLFIKLEDKKPGALDSITMLFKSTQAQIVDTLRNLDKSRQLLNRAQIIVSCAMALSQMMVNHLDLPNKIKDGLCAVLVNPICDYQTDSWLEMVAPALEMLNHIGPLRKNKNTALDDNPSYATTSLDFGRFKRHFISLLERVCRLAANQTNSTNEDAENDLPSNDEDKIVEMNESEWTNNTVSLAGIV